jgi:oligopeptide transport system ATP-binding protein
VTEPLLRAERLVKHFPVRTGLFGRAGGAVQAVDDISFDLYPGETLALVGESGCGKSTAGKLLLRLLEPTSGTVWFRDRDLLTLSQKEIRSLRREIQVIFQDPYGSLNPRMTVGDMLEEPLRLHGLHAGRETARVCELLGLVGLAPYHAHRYPHEFSGGQRQRIGIARALAVEPRLIVCDEPVSALDVSIQAQMINLLQDLQRQFGLAYVFIAHDLAVVKHIATRVAVMYLGKIVELADKRALFAEPRHPYTRALLSAIPVPDPALKKNRIVLQGDVPSPYKPPSGCRFRTRCPYVRDLCSTKTPSLEGGVACHFWREIEPFAGASQSTALNERLLRLQAAFRSGGGTA